MMPRMQKIGRHKTKIRRGGGKVHVKYWNTEVVVWDKEMSLVTLDSGGWRTATTKTRMNQAAREFGLDYYVQQRKFEWFVRTSIGVLEFRDGMTFPVLPHVWGSKGENNDT